MKTPLYTEGPEGTDLHECDATFGKISAVRVLKLLSPRGERGGRRGMEFGAEQVCWS